MIYYTLGEVLKECRIRKNLTQKQAARGICSTATIARIEQGRQMPSMPVLEELLRRLECASEFFSSLVVNAQKIPETNFAMLAQREELPDRDENVYERQLWNYVRILRTMDTDIPAETRLEQLLELLMQSCPIERLQADTDTVAYTYLELWILNSIAKSYFQLEEYDTVEESLRKLLDYLQVHPVDPAVRRMIFPLVCHNLAVLYRRTGRPEMAEQYCEAGILCCIDAGSLWILDELYLLYGLVLQAEKIEAQAQYAGEQGLFLQNMKKKSGQYAAHKRAEKIMLFSCF